jgi:hypothetical protein
MFIHALLLLFLGFVAAPTLLTNKVEALRDFYQKIAGYRAVIGAGYVLYGILRFLDTISRDFNLFYILAAVVTILLGFLLGFEWISQNIFSSNEELKAKMRDFYLKLSPYGGILALLVFAFAGYQLIDSIL